MLAENDLLREEDAAFFESWPETLDGRPMRWPGFRPGPSPPRGWSRSYIIPFIGQRRLLVIYRRMSTRHMLMTIHGAMLYRKSRYRDAIGVWIPAAHWRRLRAMLPRIMAIEGRP